MNVCGVLVYAQPAAVDTVEAALDAIPGVESHGRAQGSRLIVTVEDTGLMTAADALAQLNKLPGVIAAALVYHEFDPESEDCVLDPVPGTEEKPC